MSEASPVQETEREPLPGTVKFYENHWFVCTGRADWPARIEKDGFPQRLAQVLQACQTEMPRAVKLTACDEPSAGPGYDLLTFPARVRYHNVHASDLPALIREHLVEGRTSNRVSHTPVSNRYIFVCIHGNRDPRCGVCGPPLIERFTAELQRRGLTDSVTVRGASHVGGHRFAGNVLIYPGGDWYGYVTPKDVPQIIARHVLSGEPVPDLWRGRMGMSPEEQIRESRRRLGALAEDHPGSG